MSQALRPYQQRSLEQLREGFAAHQRQLLVIPTGGGKTTVAAHMIRATLERSSEPNTVLFMAHRTELIEQCSERLDQNGLSAHGVIMAAHGRRRPFAPVQVASVDTLANRPPLSPAPRLIIADECHRTLGGRQNRVIRDLYPRAFVVGLTATPWRLDGRGLGQYERGVPQLFTRLVLGATYAQLIADGFILEPQVLCPWKPSLRGVRKDASGDYDEAELAKRCDQPQTIADMVAVWLERANGARTVAFAASVQHSQHIAAAFQAAGVAAEHLDGTTPPEERRALLARLASGETRLVSNYGVLTEGWDCPAVEVCILARPTRSLSLHMQCVGRVLRPAASAGKTRALVLDFAGSTLNHGWPTADRAWTLADRPVEEREEREGCEDGDESLDVSVCPHCYAARPGKRGACPECGAVEASSPPDTEERSGVPLVEITRQTVARATQPRQFGGNSEHDQWTPIRSISLQHHLPALSRTSRPHRRR